MDILPSVDLLRDHLVAHDRAIQQIIALDTYIEQLSEQTWMADMGEYTTPALQQMIRIAVAEGLKRMYKEYRLHKWLKVQEMAAAVRRVIDDDGTPNEGFMMQAPNHVVPYQYEPLSESSRQQQNTAWQLTAPEAYQWQPADYDFQPTPSFIRLVSPINSPNAMTSTVHSQIPVSMSSPHQLAIGVMETRPERRQLFQDQQTAYSIETSLEQEICAIQNSSGLSDTSDEVLDSVNVNNPHGHGCGNHRQGVMAHTTSPNPQTYLPTPASLHPAGHVLSAAHTQQEVVNQSTFIPQQTQFNEHLADQDEDSMDWDSDADSSFNESEENLAGVLFATEFLLPEEQAVRLDVEMGDMGVGHMLFDRISAVWYTTQSQFYRVD